MQEHCSSHLENAAQCHVKQSQRCQSCPKPPVCSCFLSHLQRMAGHITSIQILHESRGSVRARSLATFMY